VSIGKKVHPTCARIVALVQQERERQKLSKYVIAQRSGLSQSMIGRVESGTCIPSLDTILRLADALKLDFAALVKRADSPLKPRNGK
jgi:transcriptional regulator with XRE-family HTH domain